MTRFHEAQQVRAVYSVQSMREGDVFTVAGVEVLSYFFGDVVTYQLTDGARTFAVRNGHLVLTEVSQ